MEGYIDTEKIYKVASWSGEEIILPEQIWRVLHKPSGLIFKWEDGKLIITPVIGEADEDV